MTGRTPGPHELVAGPGAGGMLCSGRACEALSGRDAAIGVLPVESGGDRRR